jgi:hypothetical protein
MVSRRAFMVGGALAAVGAGAAYAGYRGMGSMAEYSEWVSQTRSALAASPELPDLIRYATLAANSHNSQPWRFKVLGDGINILPDFTRRLSAVDPDDHHLFASLGCAAENLSIAAAMRGRAGRIGFSGEGSGVVTFSYGDGAAREPELLDAIGNRQSTRGGFDGRPVSADNLRQLAQAVAVPGVDCVLITDRKRIDRIRDLVVAGNSLQIADPVFMRELRQWLRFSPRRARSSGDGLFSAASGNPVMPEWLGPTLFNLSFNAADENAKYASQIASSSGVAVFLARSNDPEHWMLAGRACQRFALRATSLGMKHAFLNQPVEVASLREDLASVAGMPGRRPDIVMRFGYGAALPYSARRPVHAVLA